MSTQTPTRDAVKAARVGGQAALEVGHQVAHWEIMSDVTILTAIGNVNGSSMSHHHLGCLAF